jgi:hypothetical protein
VLRGVREADHVHLVTVDLANLRAAHQHAVNRPDADGAAALVTGLLDYAEWRQFFELGSWARATLQLDGVPVKHQPALHAAAGWAACIGGDFDAAVDHAQLGLSEEATGGDECGWLHDVLAHAACFQGAIAEGLRHAEVEIERARRSGDPYRLSYVLSDSGIHAGHAGDHELGTQRAGEALTIAQRLGNPDVLSMAQLATASAHVEDDPTAAIDGFRRAAAVAESVPSSRPGRAACLAASSDCSSLSTVTPWRRPCSSRHSCAPSAAPETPAACAG